jgi:hypothetical protein
MSAGRVYKIDPDSHYGKYTLGSFSVELSADEGLLCDKTAALRAAIEGTTSIKRAFTHGFKRKEKEAHFVTQNQGSSIAVGV